MPEALYVVTCRGVIDDGARARISLEFGSEGWSGGATAPGLAFPSEPQRFGFRVTAESSEEAIEAVREIVEAAGAHVSAFEARLDDQAAG